MTRVNTLWADVEGTGVLSPLISTLNQRGPDIRVTAAASYLQAKEELLKQPSSLVPPYDMLIADAYLPYDVSGGAMDLMLGVTLVLRAIHHKRVKRSVVLSAADRACIADWKRDAAVLAKINQYEQEGRLEFLVKKEVLVSDTMVENIMSIVQKAVPA